MSDVVNLNRARKKKRAAEKESLAAQNRAKFGRARADKRRIEAEESLRNQNIDSHRLDKED